MDAAVTRYLRSKHQLYFHSPSELRKLIVLNRRTNRKQTGKRQDSFEGSKRCCNSERTSATRANWKGFATMYRNRGSKKETLEKYVCWKCLMFLCANECCSVSLLVHHWLTAGSLLTSSLLVFFRKSCSWLLNSRTWFLCSQNKLKRDFVLVVDTITWVREKNKSLRTAFRGRLI